MRKVLALAMVGAVSMAQNNFLQYPLTYNATSYNFELSLINLTSEFTIGSRNFTVSLIPLFGSDYVAVADDTCEDCDFKGYNATESA